MQLLYDLCCELLQEPQIHTGTNQSTSVTYVCSEWFTQNDSILWSFRNLEEELTRLTKRRKEQDHQDGKSGDSNKKRKIREVKKIDVGSLLNTLI